MALVQLPELPARVVVVEVDVVVVVQWSGMERPTAFLRTSKASAALA